MGCSTHPLTLFSSSLHRSPTLLLFKGEKLLIRRSCPPPSFDFLLICLYKIKGLRFNMWCCNLAEIVCYSTIDAFSFHLVHLLFFLFLKVMLFFVLDFFLSGTENQGFSYVSQAQTTKGAEPRNRRGQAKVKCIYICAKEDWEGFFGVQFEIALSLIMHRIRVRKTGDETQFHYCNWMNGGSGGREERGNQKKRHQQKNLPFSR